MIRNPFASDYMFLNFSYVVINLKIPAGVISGQLCKNGSLYKMNWYMQYFYSFYLSNQRRDLKSYIH